VESPPLADVKWRTFTWKLVGAKPLPANQIRDWVGLVSTGKPAINPAPADSVALEIVMVRQSRAGAFLKKAWQNYGLVLEQVPFLRYTATSLFLVIVQVVGTVFSCSLVAYSFARLNWPGRLACIGIMLGSMMLPGQVTMIPFFLIMKELGWYNTLLPLWVPSLFANAFFVFLLVQFMRGIPRDLEDAAAIDGCGVLRIYWHVMLPLVQPTLAAIAIFTFMGVWNDFMGPLIFLQDQRLYPLSLGLYALNVQSGGGMGMMMAGSFLMTLPVILIFLFAQRYFLQGVTLTGMK
jgi:ABC-type glycerol-3-phosphate transport system permease component